ncbi:MAG: SAM-dependent methyltransferase, partial [Candidatus Bathyarchaeia archaeon]
ISGVWEVDRERQLDLARASLRIARRLLKRRGAMFVKVFDGPSLHDYAAELKQCFSDVRIVKPSASRPKSAELYFLAKGFRG